MLRNEIQGLGWIAPSRRLSGTLLRADQFAIEQRHRDLTLEHVVFGLTDDTDAARVLEANGVDVTKFRDYVARYVTAVDYRWPADTPNFPVPDSTLKRIFDVASAAAETSGRKEMDGALIVAAIIGEGTSASASMLQQHGLHIDDDDAGTSDDVEEVGQSALSNGGGHDRPSEHRQSGGGDLSDIHRMLSSPIEPQTGPAEQVVKQAAATQQTAPPVLQRTRPKQRVPQSAALPPKAVLSEQAIPGQAPANGQSLPAKGPSQANGQNQANGQGQPNSQARSAPQPQSQPGAQVQAQPQSAPLGTPHAMPSPANAGPQNSLPNSMQPGQQPRARPQPVPVDPSSNPTAIPVSNGALVAPNAVQTVDSTTGGDGFAQIDTDILGDILPAKMRVGGSEIIEIRVLNSDIDLLTGQVEGRDVAHDGGQLVSRCLSLRLRSSTSGFSIESRSPEVQWIDARTVVTGDDATSWRWQINGHRQGTARVQLLTSARTVSSDGAVLETSMPEQTARIEVRHGLGALLKTGSLVLALFGAGLMAQPLYRMVTAILFG